MKTILSRTGLSKSTIYRKVAEGTFPKPVPLGPNSSGWYESEFDRWLMNPASYRADRTLAHG